MESETADSSPDTRGFPAWLAEFFGTFLLVYVGTAAVVAGQETLGWSAPLGISELLAVAAAFAGVLGVIVYTVGNISGAHVNPAISVAMWTTGWMNLRDLAGYCVAQVAGAILASALVLGTVGSGAAGAPLGVTRLGDTPLWSGFGLEVVMTFVLAWAVAAVLTDDSIPDAANGLIIGGALFVIHFAGVNITGTSVNPARSLGPELIAVFSGSGPDWGNFLIAYLAAPVVGGMLGAWMWSWLHSTRSGQQDPVERELPVDESG